MSDPASANPVPVPQDNSQTTPESTHDSPTGAAGSVAATPGPSSDALTLRALVSTRDAGIIIGKQGKNVADLREHTGVKAGVSKVMPGVHERVLSVSGSVAGVAKAYTSILHQLVTSAPTSSATPSAPSNHTIIRLLVSHNLMGTIIGRNGLKIKNIQDVSGARMVAQKDMLPQSTERIVEVQGSPDAIGKAIEEIGRCLLEDWERGLGTVLYHPGAAGNDTITTISGLNGRRASTATAYNNPASLSAAIVDVSRRVSLADFSPLHSRSTNASTSLSSAGASSLAPITSNVPLVSVVTPPTVTIAPPSATSPSPTTNGAAAANGGQIRTQNISIPSDMVGCIIGRAGTKITEIRRLSGSKISIAKGPHDDTGERMFTIQGTPEANEKALYLLYNQLESEKDRRVSREIAQQQSADGAAAPA